jgi:hypothetical protein
VRNGPDRARSACLTGFRVPARGDAARFRAAAWRVAGPVCGLFWEITGDRNMFRLLSGDPAEGLRRLLRAVRSAQQRGVRG